MWQKNLCRCDQGSSDRLIVCLGRSRVIIRVLVRGRQEDQRRSRGDSRSKRVLELCEEGATSQGVQVTSTSWKRQRNDWPLRASRENQACWCLDFPRETSFWNSGLQSYKILQLHNFETLSLAICYRGHKKRIQQTTHCNR